MDFFGIDRKQLQKITLTIIASLTLISLVLLLIIIIGSVEGRNPNKIDHHIYNVDEIEFTDTSVTSDMLTHGTLLLVNSGHKYDIPSNLKLVNIAEYRNQHKEGEGNPYGTSDMTNMKLEANAMAQAHKMLVAMEGATGEFVYITSGFRSLEEQSKSAIEPGYSEHHTGLLMSLKNENFGELSADCAAWLNGNCSKYGFVQRYPADKSEQTGIEEYTNAYRYVGLPHSSYMTANNICLEEYIAYLKSSTSYKEPLSINGSDGSTYLVYYTEANEGDNVKLPVQTANPDGSTNFPYEISGSNDGGVIVTIKAN